MDKLNRFGLYSADPIRSTPADYRDLLCQKHYPGLGTVLGPPPERRSTISGMQGGYSTCGHNSNCNRMRNLSGGSVGSTTSGSSSGSSSNLTDNQYSSNSFSQLTFDPSPFANRPRSAAAVNNNNNSSFASSRMLSSQSSSPGTSHHHRNSRQERSSSFNDTLHGSNGNMSDRQGPSPVSQQSQRSVNSSRYKTELCRPFEESGSCKYGDKCQFAHGMHELRNLSRHPKYKTELCRTFHTIGYCPYGPRCHFIHGEEPGNGKPAPSETLPSLNLGRCGSAQSSSSSSPSLSPSGCSDSTGNFSNVFCYQAEQDNRQLNNTSSGNVNANRSSSSSSTSSFVDRFSTMNLNSNDERDIFSHITTFSEEELLDNASIPSAMGSAQFPESSQQLDNFPSFSESSSYWHPALCGDNFLSCILGSLGGHKSTHHSLTGSSAGGSSSGSDSCSSGGSDCGGSTENLNSSVFSEWRSSVAVGQY